MDHRARRVVVALSIVATMLSGVLATASPSAAAAPVFNFSDPTWRHGYSPFVNLAFTSRVDVQLPNGVAPRVGQTFMVHFDSAVVASFTIDEYFQMQLVLPSGLQLAITASNPVRCIIADIRANTAIKNAPCVRSGSGGDLLLPGVRIGNNMEVHYFVPVVATKTFAGTATQDCTNPAVVHLGVCILAASTIGDGTGYSPNPMVASVPVTVAGYSKPGAPRAVVGSSRNAAAVVTWSAPLSNGGKTITKYTVTAAPGGRTCVTTGARSCTVTGLANAHLYTFTVRATNALGLGAASVKSASVAVGTPTAPRSPKVTFPAASTAKVTWLAPVSIGSGPLTRYEIRARGSGNGGATWSAWIPWYKLPTKLSYADKGFVKGGLYEVQLRAVNASGAGVPVTFRFLQTK